MLLHLLLPPESLPFPGLSSAVCSGFSSSKVTREATHLPHLFLTPEDHWAW